MKLRDAVGLSASALVKAPARTLLTILGMSVGVAAILAVLTLGSAGQMQVEKEIARLGVDKVWVAADADSERALAATDGPAVAAAISAPVCAGSTTISMAFMNGERYPVQVAGYDEGYEAVHEPALLAGRGFLSHEYAQGATVALVDASLDEALGGAEGLRLQVGPRSVRVVGVIQQPAGQALPGVAGAVILPLRTYLDTFPGGVKELTVSVPAGRQAGAMGESIEKLLARSGGSFSATSLEEEIAAAKAVIRIFVMVLACVAAVCMLTGAIGLMNILLVSVRERRREIGLLKAIGGTAGQVALLFLLEAAGYALLGGAAGFLLGAGLVKLFGAWIGLSAAVEASTAAAVMAASALLGALFGVLPAMRAAGMRPVDALKGE